MTETTLLLIRHAHVETGPPPGVLCGWLDVSLSPAGRAQLSRFRSGAPPRYAPDALYTSTLARARETAAVLSDAWHLDAGLEDALREIYCGRLEGMPLHELQRAYPDLVARNRAQEDDDFTWPGGESYRGFRQRVLQALQRIASRHPAGRVAVVTHAGVIAQVAGCVRGRRAAVWDADRPDPLTATEIIWSNGSPASIASFNRRDWF